MAEKADSLLAALRNEFSESIYTASENNLRFLNPHPGPPPLGGIFEENEHELIINSQQKLFTFYDKWI